MEKAKSPTSLVITNWVAFSCAAGSTYAFHPVAGVEYLVAGVEYLKVVRRQDTRS